MDNIKLAKELVKVAKSLVSNAYIVPQDIMQWLNKNHFRSCSNNKYCLDTFSFLMVITIPEFASGEFIVETSWGGWGLRDVIKATGRNFKEVVKKAINELIKNLDSKIKKLEKDLLDNKLKDNMNEKKSLITFYKKGIKEVNDYRNKLSL